MPTYDYVCSSCGHRMEVMHGVHGRGPSECPVCGGQMRKAFVAPAVVFKGSGWAKKERSSAAKAKASKASDGRAADGASEGSTGGPEGGTKPLPAPAKDTTAGGE